MEMEYIIISSVYACKTMCFHPFFWIQFAFSSSNRMMRWIIFFVWYDIEDVYIFCEKKKQNGMKQSFSNIYFKFNLHFWEKEKRKILFWLESFLLFLCNREYENLVCTKAGVDYSVDIRDSCPWQKEKQNGCNNTFDSTAQTRRQTQTKRKKQNMKEKHTHKTKHIHRISTIHLMNSREI